MRVLIGNGPSAEVVGEVGKDGIAWWGQSLVWFAQDHDILILPEEPQESWLEYVTSMTGTRRSSLQVLVPPPGAKGEPRLTPDRLLSSIFSHDLQDAVGGRDVEEVVAIWPDSVIVSVARLIDAADVVPGAGFLLQGGGVLANSKAVFRAVASGAGVPISPGAVCAGLNNAESAILEFVEQGKPVMAKHEFMGGGMGNHVVSPTDGVSSFGAVTVAYDRSTVRRFLEDNWPYLTNSGKNRLVVEQYFPEHTAAYAEFLVGDTDVTLGAEGQLLSAAGPAGAPLGAAQVIPPPEVATPHRVEIVDGGRRLCESLRLMGYRGRLSADAIVTADGEVLFTEYNGRITGSTHTYSVIGDVVVGNDFTNDRMLLERNGWKVPSFEAAIDGLTANGLAYDRRTRSGVLLSAAFGESSSTVWYCVAAPDYSTVQEYEKALTSLFGTAGSGISV